MHSKQPIRKPPELRPGDLIAVIAPSSPVEAAQLQKGVGELETIGYRVVSSDCALARHSFYAGDHRARAEDLLQHLEDPAVRAVFCARGGYGSNYVVEQLAAPAILRRLEQLTPKIVMGYSDVTSLLLFLNQALGWVTFQGPMVSRDLSKGESGYDRTLMQQVLASEGSGGTVGSDARTLRGGAAEGRLLGGCLPMLAATLGTPQEIDTRGSILLLEDVDEKPFRIDRMLFHLRRAGKFRQIQAAVFGEMPGCGLNATPEDSLREIILEAFAESGVPVVFGMRFGHTTGRCLTLPLGVRARLEASGQVKLTFLEPAVGASEKEARRVDS